MHRRLRRHQYMNNRRDRLAKQKHLHTCVGSALCFWANRLFAMSTLPLRTLRSMATLPRGGRCRVAASIRRFSARICFSRRTSTTAAAIAACTAANSDSITSSTPLQARTRGKHPKVIECKPSERSWLKFHRYTAGMLGGHETCDCYRENVFPKHCYRGQDWATCGITENRVYRGGSSGAELTMFQWLGRGYRPHGNIRRAGISGALADSAGVAATKRTSEMASSNGTNSGGNDGTGSSPPPSACPVGFGGVEGHSSWTSPNLTHLSLIHI